MDAAESRSQREKQLPDLDALDVQSLKALVLTQQAELDSRTNEIENLKLLILKLKRMHFGPRSEKRDHDIQQLELRLEDLEANQAAAEPPPAVPATVALNQKAPSKPARRPLPAALPRETESIEPPQKACPDCGGTLRRLGEDVSETLEYVPARFKVIRVLRYQHMRQQPRPSQATIDHPIGRRSLHDLRAARAAQLRPHRADHLEPSRDIFQRLRNVLT